MATPHITIPTDMPGLRRAKETIAEHQRLARDNGYLAKRILEVAATDPRVDDTAKMIRLARLLDTTAWFHARKAQALTNELAGVCAAFQPDD